MSIIIMAIIIIIFILYVSFTVFILWLFKDEEKGTKKKCPKCGGNGFYHPITNGNGDSDGKEIKCSHCKDGKIRRWVRG